MEIKTVCVFCGSSTGFSPVFGEKAAILGRKLAEKGINLVYGGGSIGLMNIVASSALEGGARVTGIIPELINGKVAPLDGIKTIVTKGMHERKAAMYEMSDAFIALPGGPGTFEELLEVFAWKHIGYHAKPVALLNTDGFYDSLMKLLEKAAECGFLKMSHMESLIISEDPDELISLVLSHRHHHVDKWSH